MRWLVLALIILVATLSTALFLKKGPQVSTVRESAPIAASVSTSTISEETSAYSIKANYPVFGIPQLDAKIRSHIDAGITEIKGMEPNPSPNNIKNEFVSLFQRPYVGEDVASVELIVSQYTGGAHNNSAAIGVNFDLKAKRFLTLDDALKMTGKSLDELSVIAQAALTESLGTVQFPDGIAATAENYATFVVEKERVRFIFQEYQVAAFAAGMPEFAIPRVK